MPFCLYLQHKPNIQAPAGFFWLLLCTLFVVLCPDCPGFCLLSVLYNTHNTNIHASGGNQTRNPSKRAAQTYTLDRAANGIRTRNPSRRSAADPRLGPLGHWDRQDSNPQPQQAVGRRPSPWNARSLGSAGFEPATSASDRQQTLALDR